MNQEREVAPMQAMQIGEVARRSGVGIETIRYYEREGLLHEPQRRPSGYRLYDAATLKRLEYICRAKELGFTLGEIKELLELSFAPNERQVEIRRRAEAKITAIEDKIRSLQNMRRLLLAIVKECEPARRCPLDHGADD
jgi:MerR family transcriptional regulator, copper efflux regulator